MDFFNIFVNYMYGPYGLVFLLNEHILEKVFKVTLLLPELLSYYIFNSSMTSYLFSP